MITVTIAGRPNVGKSTLFNALAGRRIAVTDHVAGTTRDILETEISVPAGRTKVYQAMLVDSGGMGAVDEPGIREKVEERIERALAKADIIIFLTDAITGITDLDYLAAERVKKLRKPVILAANKCETESRELEAHVFGKLGFGPPIMIAAQEGKNLDGLIDRLAQIIKKERLGKPVSAAAVRKEKEAAEAQHEAETEKSAPAGRHPGPMRLAVLGRRNTGKSTFVNALAGEDRCIVSAIPGTTRDSLDVEIDYRGRKMVVIDTAGIVRHREGKSTIEFKSTVRTERAIRRADVVMLFVDAMVPVGRIEREAARLIGENFKPSIIVVNKWDLSAVSEDEFVKYLDEKLRFTVHHAVAFISAANKAGLDGLVKTAWELFEAAGRKLTTGVLNRAVARFVEEHALPTRGTKVGKIYYAVQTGTYPPEFTLFVNREETFDDGYLRYMMRRLAAELGSEELPVRVILRGRRKPGRDARKCR